MNIDELTLKQIREISSLGIGTSKSHSYVIGKNYFIRGATWHYVGKLISITDTDIVLSDASFIGSDGRFHNMLRDGLINEIEPYMKPVLITRNSIADATEWDHDLPKGQK